MTSETPRLVGFCLAVRRSAFEAIGGFDEEFGTGGAEDDDLGIRLMHNGGRLLICHESFVHHHGHATFQANGLDWFAIQQNNMERFRAKHMGGTIPKRRSNAPLLSACMIIKDEVEMLPQCLASLSGVVDEVVIYDTGSTDGSIELAREAGANVIEGFWDDDFGRARNASLDHCTGEWALHIDADEVFDGDAQKFRDELLNTTLSAYQVEILNVAGDEKNNLTHRPARVFKRAIYHWQGRLHEQLTMRNGLPRTDFGIIEGSRLVHYGYTAEQMQKKNKAERNVRIAQIDADDDDGRDPMDKLTNLGRSMTLAGRHEEALSLFNQARSMTSDSQVVYRTLYRAGAQAAITVGRPAEALDWAEELAKVSHFQDTSNYFKGISLTQLHRFDEALEAMSTLDTMTDDDGVVFPVYLVHMHRAMCLASIGKWEEATDEVTFVATEEAHDEPIWALVAECYWRTGRDINELMRKIPAKHMNAIFGQLAKAPAEAADKVLESLYAFDDRRASVLALAIRTAPMLSVERALEWSARLRQHNLALHCPLIAKAEDPRQPAEARLKSAAIAMRAFDDDRAPATVASIAAQWATDDYGKALETLNELCPQFLEPFIVGASTDARRAFAMAKALHALGAPDEAAAVLQFGLGKDGGHIVAADAASWLESVGQGTIAAAIREATSV